jgi:hypothetical protein
VHNNLGITEEHRNRQQVITTKRPHLNSRKYYAFKHDLIAKQRVHTGSVEHATNKSLYLGIDRNNVEMKAPGYTTVKSKKSDSNLSSAFKNLKLQLNQHKVSVRNKSIIETNGARYKQNDN